MPPSPARNGNDQPVLAIGGLIIDASRLEQLTQSFLDLKSHWYPGLAYSSHKHLDKIIPEIKGRTYGATQRAARETPAVMRSASLTTWSAF